MPSTKLRPFVLMVMVFSAFAGDKYPLTMTAVFTKGTVTNPARTTYHSGDYDCTAGDEHHSPDCRTSLEWAQLDRIGGVPDIVVFTLSGGSRIGVHSLTVNKIPDYIECSPYGVADVIFCALYREMQRATLVGGNLAAIDARQRELFGGKNEMTVAFHYRLKGKVEKDGFQRIEVDPHACSSCNLVHLLNPHGDGYYMAIKHPPDNAAH